MTDRRGGRGAAATVAACVALLSSLFAGASVRAESVGVRVPDVAPRGRIGAADLRRLSLEPAPAKRAGREGAGREREFEPNAGEEPMIRPGSQIPNVPASPTASQRAQSFSYTWSLRHSFHGNSYGPGYPTDGGMAVGPSHIVSMVNGQVRMYDKTGTVLSTVTDDAFFPNGSNVPSLYDPRVEYDPASGRFFAIELAVGATANAAWELAVSTSSDPTAGWVFYEISNVADSSGIDYPYLGFGAGAVYLSGNYRNVLFGWPKPVTPHANGLWVIDKAALVAGTTAAVWRFVDLFGASTYATAFGCARWSAPPRGLDDFLVSWEFADGTTWRGLIWGVTLPSGWPGASPTLDLHTYTTPAPGPVPNCAQKGGPALLMANNIGSPPSLPIFINGHIHSAIHAPSGAGLLVRHFDVNVSSWTSVSGTAEDFWDGSSFHCYPSVAVNPWGDVALVYDRSSTNEYASAHWAIRGQEEGFYQADSVLRAGTAYYGTGTDNATTTYRWGDYSAATIDPVTGGLWFLSQRAIGQATAGVENWIGYVPHAVFVDASALFVHTGSKSNPYGQMMDGYNAAWNDNDLVLKAGSYHTGGAILSKPLFIKSDGGTAVITP